MKENKQVKKQIAISVIAIVALIAIVTSVSYSMFSYAKVGDIENIISTGGITFLYQENLGTGNGVTITNAFPITDENGKKLSTEGSTFDFSVSASTTNANPISYEVTLRKDNTSTLSGDYVKVYLVENDGTEVEAPLTVTKNGTVKRFNELAQTTLSVGADENGVKYDERTIYVGTTKSSSKNFEKNFRLRMWIADDTDFSPIKNADGTYKLDETGNYVYPNSGKTFTARVNVYAKAE